jgi:hypothetical protein
MKEKWPRMRSNKEEPRTYDKVLVLVRKDEYRIGQWMNDRFYTDNRTEDEPDLGLHPNEILGWWPLPNQ